MKIIKHKSQNLLHGLPNYNKDLYTCRIDNRSFTSPDYSSVMKWRDENVPNAEYYKEIKVLHDKAMQSMYDNNPTNYTGD
jgi:hypothetical protein